MSVYAITTCTSCNHQVYIHGVPPMPATPSRKNKRIREITRLETWTAAGCIAALEVRYDETNREWVVSEHGEILALFPGEDDFRKAYEFARKSLAQRSDVPGA